MGESMSEPKPLGRPSGYNDEYAKQALKLCRMGATDRELADFFEVCEKTLAVWKLKHKGFIKAIRSGKDEFDTKLVEGSLKHRAMGYDHEETKVLVVGGEVVEHKVVKHYPPDTAAMIFWLKNRDKNRWRDRQDVEHTGNVGHSFKMIVHGTEKIEGKVSEKLAEGVEEEDA